MIMHYATNFVFDRVRNELRVVPGWRPVKRPNPNWKAPSKGGDTDNDTVIPPLQVVRRFHGSIVLDRLELAGTLAV